MTQRWSGWCWRHGRWERVCTGQSLEECSRRLSAEADRLRVPDRHCVLTSGQMPNFIPKTTTRRRRSAAHAKRSPFD
jgi:hypothetical protein